ncbi:MAG: hypothetical protein MZV64_22910 [Ignavibacteriales bacterium]|nr:hypothetical protein [Ignavibacteriales bacterium]
MSQSYFNNCNLRLGVQQPLFTGLPPRGRGRGRARLLETVGRPGPRERPGRSSSSPSRAPTGGSPGPGIRERSSTRPSGRPHEHLKDVRAFFDQGLVTRNDVLRAELELSNAEIVSDRRPQRGRGRPDLAQQPRSACRSTRTSSLTTTAESMASRLRPSRRRRGRGSDRRGRWPTGRSSSRPSSRIKASETGRQGGPGRALSRRSSLAGNYYYLRPESPVSCRPLDQFNGTWDLGAIRLVRRLELGPDEAPDRAGRGPAGPGPGRPQGSSRTRPSWRSPSAA